MRCIASAWHTSPSIFGVWKTPWLSTSEPLMSSGSWPIADAAVKTVTFAVVHATLGIALQNTVDQPESVLADGTLRWTAFHCIGVQMIISPLLLCARARRPHLPLTKWMMSSLDSSDTTLERLRCFHALTRSHMYMYTIYITGGMRVVCWQPSARISSDLFRPS